MRSQLLHQIVCSLDARCALQDLEAWVLSNLQTILDSGDEAAILISNEMDADFVQLGEGIIDEAEFLERLRRYAGHLETTFSEFSETSHTATTRATAAVETVRSRVDVRAVVDLRLSHSFA